jgi:hypothetical protein
MEKIQVIGSSIDRRAFLNPWRKILFTVIPVFDQPGKLLQEPDFHFGVQFCRVFHRVHGTAKKIGDENAPVKLAP